MLKETLEEAAARLFTEDQYPTSFETLRKAFISNAKLSLKKADTPNPAEDLIQSLRLLTDTFTHNELEMILEQLYYVKSQEKLEYYFDQIKLNATAADIRSAFQYGYFDTLTAMGKN